jgi:UPF0755 protein
MKTNEMNWGWTFGLLLAAASALLAMWVYYRVCGATFVVEQPVAVFVDNRKDFARLVSQLEEEAGLTDPDLFCFLAQWMRYPKNMKTGRYEILPGTSYRDVIRMLRSGRQTPVRLTFHNLRRKADLANRIGEEMLFSPADLLRCLNDSLTAAAYGMDTTTILTLFIPNTYEIYWNTPVDRFMDRMKKEYDRFWNADRRAKAQALGLSRQEVAILASIVEEETSARGEYATVAGLYVNRLRKGMLLQADPAVKFAVGDPGLRRILNVHLGIDSPYNTYRYGGLPPGQIRIPSIPAIDSVLNYGRHSYLYMCAKEDFSGTHRFATTLAEHNRNAQRYRRALDRLQIR